LLRHRARQEVTNRMENKIPIIELKNIGRVYRAGGRLERSVQEVVALNGIYFKIHRGEIFGLVGESGSGKTTTARLIVKLEEPDSGTLFMDGQDITRLARRDTRKFRRRVQMIFQDPYQSLNPYLSVFDTVCEPLIIHRLGRTHARAELVAEALQSVGLAPPEEYFHRFPHQLSGGQRQRVAIARAIVIKPDLIVADEPTSMLDPPISIQIFNILRELRETLHVTFLLITHSLVAARYLCDRIAVIYRGKIVESGPAESIIRNPTHDYTRALIKAQPRFPRETG
jgi:peptide/nickel transport system ATP-binding protein